MTVVKYRWTTRMRSSTTAYLKTTAIKIWTFYHPLFFEWWTRLHLKKKTTNSQQPRFFLGLFFFRIQKVIKCTRLLEKIYCIIQFICYYNIEHNACNLYSCTWISYKTFRSKTKVYHICLRKKYRNYHSLCIKKLLINNQIFMSESPICITMYRKCYKTILNLRYRLTIYIRFHVFISVSF